MKVSSIHVDRDVPMSARDGVILRSDVIRPDVSEPVPAIVCRTPYDKSQRLQDHSLFPPLFAAANGFAVVFQDVRGRFASEGEFDYLKFDVELPDTYDCLEWVAAQPWCDGNIGMVGYSYEAACQFIVARAQPASLKAIAPAGTATFGGIRLSTMRLESLVLGWTAMAAVDALQKKLEAGEIGEEGHADLMATKVLPVMRSPVEAAATLPLKELPTLTIPGMPSYAELMDQFLQAAEVIVGGEEQILVPALLTSGWYEGVSDEVYRGMRDRTGSEAARLGTKLIIGPWPHTGSRYESCLGERGFGQSGGAAEAGLPQAHLDFFSRHLRDEEAPELPNLKYFLMGANEWREADDWPVTGVEEPRLYLHSEGHANTAEGDGALVMEPPAGDEPPDRYVYDPASPAPSFGGNVPYFGGTTVPGPFDQARIERREDVLVYTSEPLRAPIEIVGLVELHLFVSSSARDTDFAVKVCDVDRDGISHNICDTIVRMRWRGGWRRGDPAVLLEPGEVNELRIDLGGTANMFLEGHRVRVHITSSAFPYWERNMNTGNPVGEDAKGVVAEQQVYHSAEHPSCLLLPMLAVHEDPAVRARHLAAKRTTVPTQVPGQSTTKTGA